MSGGSHNYLFLAEAGDLLNRISDLEEMEADLIKLGYDDIARDVRRLIEYCRSAENRIGVLSEQLENVFHDVEWYCSADIGKERLEETIRKYREGNDHGN